MCARRARKRSKDENASKAAMDRLRIVADSVSRATACLLVGGKRTTQ